MTILDDIRVAVAELREIRRRPTRGQALHELNLWLGQARKDLQEEYSRRLSQIEAEPEPSMEDRVSPKVLDLVAKAVGQKMSRSNIRRALGLTTLDEADEVIALAVGKRAEEAASGKAEGFDLFATGEVHSKGWPMYKVNLLPENKLISSVYLVTTARTTQVERRHLRLTPSVPGSEEILDEVWSSGAAQVIFDIGKEES